MRNILLIIIALLIFSTSCGREPVQMIETEQIPKCYVYQQNKDYKSAVGWEDIEQLIDKLEDTAGNEISYSQDNPDIIFIDVGSLTYSFDEEQGVITVTENGKTTHYKINPLDEVFDEVRSISLKYLNTFSTDYRLNTGSGFVKINNTTYGFTCDIVNYSFYQMIMVSDYPVEDSGMRTFSEDNMIALNRTMIYKTGKIKLINYNRPGYYLFVVGGDN